MSSHKVVCIKMHQKVMDHWFRLWQNETIQEKCVNWRKSSRYSDMIKYESLHIIETLETEVLLRSAFTVTRLIKFCPYKIKVVTKLKQSDYAVRIYFCSWLLWNEQTDLWIHNCSSWLKGHGFYLIVHNNIQMYECETQWQSTSAITYCKTKGCCML
jgi:hypothetical protein